MRPATAPELLRTIRRLHRQLRTLPRAEQPHDGRRDASPRYRALEAQIRRLADRYQQLTP